MNMDSTTDGAGGGNTRPSQVASLDETLLLLNRVVQAAVTSIVVSDPRLPDNPIVFHNPAFETVTGYCAGEIIGRNCRFLQGADTDPETVAELRRAIASRSSCSVVIQNYRKDGTAFWNDLAVSPVHDDKGAVTHYVGVQSDVTNRVIAESERNLLLQQQQRIAELLQHALLLNPPATTLVGVEISTQYLPASDEAKIGGDFFDTVALSETTVALVVGDYVGKGLEAAQYTAEVKYALRVLLREYGDPTIALKRLNTFLLDSQRLNARADGALVCISVAVLDTATGAVSLACGGMEPPLVVRSGGAIEVVETQGMVVGTFEEARFDTKTLTLDAGDTLILVTDGITEARSPRPQRDMFGYDGLTAMVWRAESLSVDRLGARIVAGARDFAAGKLQDDVCVLLARRTEAAGVCVSADGAQTFTSGDDTALSADSAVAQFALEGAGMGYFELDTTTCAAKRSPRHDEIFGYDAPLRAWSYDLFLSHVHEDDRERVAASYTEAVETGSDWRFECRIRRFDDGTVRYIAVNARYFHGSVEEGEAEGSGTVRDSGTVLVGTVADISPAA